MARTPVTVHRHLALVSCDSAATLAEVLARLDMTNVPHQRFGDRAVALPAPVAAIVRDSLRAHGAFPRIVGEITRAAAEEEE